MPFVQLKRNRRTVSREVVVVIRDHIRRVVAEALNIPGDPECQLTPEDVDVDIEDDHPLNDNERDYGLTIIANSHPDRMKNLGERADVIAKAIGSLPEMSALKGYIYIAPTAGVYRTISNK